MALLTTPMAACPRLLLSSARQAQQTGDFRRAALVLRELAEIHLADGEIERALAAAKLGVDFIIRAAGDPTPLEPGDEPYHVVLNRLLDMRAELLEHLAA